MKKVSHLFILTMVFGILAVGTVSAQITRYVNPDGICGGNTPCYTTIQAAIIAAAPGDTIIVAAGTYPEKLTVNKAGQTIEGDGSYPMIQPTLGDCTKYDTVIMVNANDVTIRGLDISNAHGVVDQQTCGHIEHHGIWDGSWTVGPSGLTVDDCKFHDIEHGVRSYGAYFSVTNSKFYRLGRTGVYASGYNASVPLPMTVKHNWFHDFIPEWKENHAVHVKYDGRVGEVCYNYISGMRMGIGYYYGGPKSGFGDIIFSHNTFDLDYDLDGGTKDMTMGISLWGTGANADNIIIRDNIFANAWWFAIYQEGATISGKILVDNNLFYNNYWYYWPDYQYIYQWFGDDEKAQAGWTGGATGFTFTNNITVQDPLFALSDPGAEGQWALLGGSPALGSASDDTNIGAWQGAPPPPFIVVAIDIKPGGDQNTINLSSAGVISVAILSSDAFDATTVDPGTVTLAGAVVKMTGKSNKYLSQERDVNNDGLLDLVCQVITAQFLLETGDTIAMLEAETYEGQSIRGEDIIRIVPDEKF